VTVNGEKENCLKQNDASLFDFDGHSLCVLPFQQSLLDNSDCSFCDLGDVSQVLLEVELGMRDGVLPVVHVVKHIHHSFHLQLHSIVDRVVSFQIFLLFSV